MKKRAEQQGREAATQENAALVVENARLQEQVQSLEMLLVTLEFQHEAHGDVHRPRRLTVLQLLKLKLHQIWCN